MYCVSDYILVQLVSANHFIYKTFSDVNTLSYNFSLKVSFILLHLNIQLLSELSLNLNVYGQLYIQKQSVEVICYTKPTA